MRSHTLARLFSWAVALAVPAVSVDPGGAPIGPAGQLPRFKAGVDQVRLDVIVTSRGRP